jgi:hypothetical protein
MSRMTKQDYELIAGSMRRTVQVIEWLEKNEVKRQAKRDAMKLLAQDLSGSLANDNPLFDGDKFLAACGLTD